MCACTRVCALDNDSKMVRAEGGAGGVGGSRCRKTDHYLFNLSGINLNLQ